MRQVRNLAGGGIHDKPQAVQVSSEDLLGDSALEQAIRHIVLTGTDEARYSFAWPSKPVAGISRIASGGDNPNLGMKTNSLCPLD